MGKADKPVPSVPGVAAATSMGYSCQSALASDAWTHNVWPLLLGRGRAVEL